jgi:CHASE3 domain sensor protein
MYIDGNLLFAIYFIAVLALAVSAYALWSLEEIRKYYNKQSNKKPNVHRPMNIKSSSKKQAAGYYDKFIGK